jgi:putative flippase GtrA
MGKMSSKKQFILFCVVGFINTLLDLSLYFLLHQVMGIPAYIASPIVVILVMTFSYFMNAKLVFYSDLNFKQYIEFMLLTGVGVIIIQTAISQFFEDSAYQFLVSLKIFSGTELNTFLANSIVRMSGILFSLTWNFLFYKYVVFKVTGREVVDNKSTQFEDTSE